MVKILYSPRFKKSFLRLERRIRELAFIKMDVFIHDPFDARLKTHKLHGAFSGYYAFSSLIFLTLPSSNSLLARSNMCGSTEYCTSLIVKEG